MLRARLVCGQAPDNSGVPSDMLKNYLHLRQALHLSQQSQSALKAEETYGTLDAGGEVVISARHEPLKMWETDRLVVTSWVLLKRKEWKSARRDVELDKRAHGSLRFARLPKQ